MDAQTMRFFRAVYDHVVFTCDRDLDDFYGELAAFLPNDWVTPEFLVTGRLNGRRYLSMRTNGKKSLVFLPLNWEVAT